MGESEDRRFGVKFERQDGWLCGMRRDKPDAGKQARR
jgi:hypothetical protein